MIDRLPDLFHRVKSTFADNAFFKRPSEQSVKLEKKWVEKWDKDLRTIASLHAYAQSTGRVLALQGGIATDAHCGGHITRPHSDVDTVLYMHPTLHLDHDKDRLEIYTLLQKEKDTKWLPNKGEKLDFQEDITRKPWSERRRVEVNLADYPVGERTQTMNLIDSKGRSQTVTVEHIDLLVAKKAIAIVNNIGKLGMPRPTRQSDLDDMWRLMAQSRYNRNHCLTFAQSYYIHVEGLTPEQASSKANEVLQKAEAIKSLHS